MKQFLPRLHICFQLDRCTESIVELSEAAYSVCFLTNALIVALRRSGRFSPADRWPAEHFLNLRACRAGVFPMPHLKTTLRIAVNTHPSINVTTYARLYWRQSDVEAIGVEKVQHCCLLLDKVLPFGNALFRGARQARGLREQTDQAAVV